MNTLEAVALGVIEGLTEYLPISSTGHLILAEHLLGISEGESSKVFAIAIQLGAIIAVIWLYWDFFLKKVNGLFEKNKNAIKFFLNITIAFLPVAFVGLLARKWIKTNLFSPIWVLAALVVGGVVMLLVEKYVSSSQGKKAITIDQMSYRDSLFIGVCQIFSLWPGFSRAMSTILGGRLVGLDAKNASEFSFFLAVPTLGAATVYEMYKAFKDPLANMDVEWWKMLAVGMGVSFAVAVIVIKALLAFLRKYPLSIFAYYRIVLGVGLYFLLK